MPHAVKSVVLLTLECGSHATEHSILQMVCATFPLPSPCSFWNGPPIIFGEGNLNNRNNDFNWDLGAYDECLDQIRGCLRQAMPYGTCWESWLRALSFTVEVVNPPTTHMSPSFPSSGTITS